MAKLRLDWKYALRQELDWNGFHYSDLCNSRKRLLKHGQVRTLFEGLLDYLREQGFVKAGGRQRTGATHIVGTVKQMSDAEAGTECADKRRCKMGDSTYSDEIHPKLQEELAEPLHKTDRVRGTDAANG